MGAESEMTRYETLTFFSEIRSLISRIGLLHQLTLEMVGSIITFGPYINEQSQNAFENHKLFEFSQSISFQLINKTRLTPYNLNLQSDLVFPK